MLGWTEVERNVVGVAEAASLVLNAECVATAGSEKPLNVVATADFVLLLLHNGSG